MDRLPLDVDGRDSCRRDNRDVLAGAGTEELQEGGFPRAGAPGEEDMARGMLEHVVRAQEFRCLFYFFHASILHIPLKFTRGIPIITASPGPTDW